MCSGALCPDLPCRRAPCCARVSAHNERKLFLRACEIASAKQSAFGCPVAPPRRGVRAAAGTRRCDAMGTCRAVFRLLLKQGSVWSRGG